MRSAAHVPIDASILRDWLGRGMRTTGTATFKSGAPTVADSGSITQTTSSASVSGILVRIDREEGRLGKGRSAPLAGGSVDVDAVFWVENAASAFDSRTSILIGPESFEVVDVATWPGLGDTKLLYLKRRK